MRDLMGVNMLGGFSLDNANLAAADLQKARNLTQEQRTRPTATIGRSCPRVSPDQADGPGPKATRSSRAQHTGSDFGASDFGANPDISPK